MGGQFAMATPASQSFDQPLRILAFEPMAPALHRFAIHSEGRLQAQAFGSGIVESAHQQLKSRVLLLFWNHFQKFGSVVDMQAGL